MSPLGDDIGVVSRQLAEAERKEALERERADAENAMINYISHEIRGPMAIAIQVLDNGKTELFPAAKQALKYALGILNTHLDLSKCEKGQVDLIITSVDDVGQMIVAPVAEMLQLECRSKVELQVSLPTEPIRASLDLQRVQQVLTNLVSNALKYTDHGCVQLDLGKDESFLIFTITDTGCGIQIEDVPQLFQKWQQLGVRSRQGSGLGLALVKQLLDLMDGEIVHDSTYTDGTRFLVKVPYVSPRTRSGSVISTFRPRIFNGTFRILIVDDVKEMREVMTIILEKMFPNGSFAYASKGEGLVDQHYDLITIDYFLNEDRHPGILTGVQTVAKMRANGVRSIIIGISANPKETEFLKAGANAFCRKGGEDMRAELGELLAGLIKVPYAQRVLILDDDFLAGRMFKLLLEKVHPSWSITTVQHSEDVSMDFDLYILDENLAGGDFSTGTKVAQAIRRANHQAIIVGRSGGEFSNNSAFDAIWCKPCVDVRECLVALYREQDEPFSEFEQVGLDEPFSEFCMKICSGDQAIMTKMLKILLGGLPAYIAKLREGQDLQRHAHSMKGSLRTFYVAAGETAAQLAEACNEKRDTTLLVVRLIGELEELEVTTRKYLNE
jgi:CheY-like chemotaxis protein/HPt (histidine-containing phosphotransfer) domain-containing protein